MSEPGQVRVSVLELIQRCGAAYERMSAKNGHRVLIGQCAQVLAKQANAIAELRAQVKPAETVAPAE